MRSSVDHAVDPVVEAAPHLVVGISVDLVHQVPHALGEALEDAVFGRARQPPGRLLAEAFPEAALVLVEELLQPREDAGEELLVAVLGGHHPQGPAGQLRDGQRFDTAVEHVGQHAVDVLVPHRVGQAHHEVGRLPGQHLAVCGVGGPGRGPVDRPRRPHPFDDDVGGEEVLLHEGTERLAELVLAFADDGGVGDREAERVAEQRGHREPVGHATHHRRLGRSLDVAPPAPPVAHDHDHHERDRGEHE